MSQIVYKPVSLSLDPDTAHKLRFYSVALGVSSSSLANELLASQLPDVEAIDLDKCSSQLTGVRSRSPDVVRARLAQLRQGDLFNNAR